MLAKSLRLYKNSFSGLSRDIWLLAAVTLLNRAGTMVIPFMTVFLTHEKGFTLQQAGWVMTSFGVGSVAGSYAGGWLSDRYSFSKVQFWTLFLSGFMFIVLQVVEGVLPMCGAVFVLSLIADAFRPANMSAVAAYSTSETRTRSLSLNRLAVNLGFAIGPAVGGWLAASKGYNWLFWVDGLTCISAAFLLRLLLSPRNRQIDKQQPAEVSTPPISAYRDWHYLAFIAITMFSAIAFMQLFFTYPVFLKSEYGLSESYIGSLMALNGLLIAVAEMPLVYTLERRFTPPALIGTGYMMVAASFLIFNIFAVGTLIPLISMIIVTLGEMLYLPFTNSLAMSRPQASNRGQYLALYTMAFSAANVVAPTLGMQIAGAWGYETLWYVTAGFCLLALIGLWLLRELLAKSKWAAELS